MNTFGFVCAAAAAAALVVAPANTFAQEAPKAAQPPATAPAQPPATPPDQPPATPPEQPPATPPAEPPPTLGSSVSNAKVFNPDIAVIGDFLGAAGTNDVHPTPAMEMHE